MNDAYYTQTGERPDLAAIEVNAPEGYIGDKILPITPVNEKTGTIYYATIPDDATAATSRAAGTGPAAVQISDGTTSFTATEWVTRGGIVPDEVKTMGGIEKADVVGAKYAKRNAMNALEADICTAILGKAAADQFDAAKMLTITQTALQSIRRYEGKTALISSTATLKRIVQQIIGDDSVGPLFSRLISGSSPLVALTGMNFESWKAGLAMYLGVDMVLAGDDTIWNATTYDGHYAIAKLDDGVDQLSHKYKPVLGKTYMFMPDGKIPYVIQAVADRVNVNNLYDCYIWFDSVILNTAALYVFDGVAA